MYMYIYNIYTYIYIYIYTLNQKTFFILINISHKPSAVCVDKALHEKFTYTVEIKN